MANLSICALATVLAFTLLSPGALAQTRTIPTPDGSVFITDANSQRAYDEIGFAPSRRAGDTLYVSGVIIYRRQNEATDIPAFRVQARRAFERLDQHLRAAGLTFDNVAMINSFHVWQGPNFTGTPNQQIDVLNELKAEFIKGPHPAWTAVGTTGLLGETGIVEIQLIAQYPRPAQPR